MLKKILISSLIAVLLIVSIVVGNFIGNPLTKLKISKQAEKYLEENYRDNDFEIVKVSYNFKDGTYPVQIQSKSSKDTHFLLSFKSDGKIDYDYYEDYVESKFNVYVRLNNEYREHIEAALNNLNIKINYSYGELMIIEDDIIPSFNNENYIEMKSLILDKEYDINELGERCGNITISIEDSDVSYEKFAEYLLKIKSELDKNGTNFARINMILSNKDNKDKISINSFPYKDIKKESLIKFVEQQHKQTEKYWEDLKK